MQEVESLGNELEKDHFSGLRVVKDLEMYGKNYPMHGVSLGTLELYNLNIRDSNFVNEFVIDDDTDNQILELIVKLLCGEAISEEEKGLLAEQFDDYKLRISTLH